MYVGDILKTYSAHGPPHYPEMTSAILRAIERIMERYEDMLHVWQDLAHELLTCHAKRGTHTYPAFLSYLAVCCWLLDRGFDYTLCEMYAEHYLVIHFTIFSWEGFRRYCADLSNDREIDEAFRRQWRAR